MNPLQTSRALQLRPFDPVLSEVRQRSVALGADPKARELRHFLGSHSHESRLRASVGANANRVEPLPPTIDMSARLNWRSEMDRGIRRLMQDTDLALDDRIPEESRHHLRCNQLDKVYSWFERHGNKEASKEREAPSYLRFERTAPPMAGSPRWRPKSTGSSDMPSTHSVFVSAAVQTVGTQSIPNAGNMPNSVLAPEGVRFQVLNNLAEGEWEKGFQTATDELAITRKENDKFGEALMMLTLAELNLVKYNIDEGLHAANFAKSYFEAKKNEPIFEGRAHLALSNGLALKGELNEAVIAAKTALNITLRAGDKKGESEAWETLSTLEAVDKEVMHCQGAGVKRRLIAEFFAKGKRLEQQLARAAKGSARANSPRPGLSSSRQNTPRVRTTSFPNSSPRATPLTGSRKSTKLRAAARLT